MKSVEYSQLVKRKLLKLKKELAGEYGEEKTKEILTAMADHVDMLGQHEESGVSISRMYDIDTDYWYIFTNHRELEPVTAVKAVLLPALLLAVAVLIVSLMLRKTTRSKQRLS